MHPSPTKNYKIITGRKEKRRENEDVSGSERILKWEIKACIGCCEYVYEKIQISQWDTPFQIKYGKPQ